MTRINSVPDAQGISIQPETVKVSISWPMGWPKWSELPELDRRLIRSLLESAAQIAERSLQ